MKPSHPAKLAASFSIALSLGTAATHASLHWIGNANGGDGTSMFLEANWDSDGDPAAPHTTPAADTVNPSASIDDDVFVASGTPGGPDGATGPLQLGNPGSLTVSGGTFRMVAGSGIRADATAGGTQAPITLSNDAAIFSQFFLDIALSVSDSASLTLYGGGNPVNESTIDLAADWTGTLTFDAETPAAAVSEHLSKITVGGAAAVVGADPAVLEAGDNVLIVSDGGSGSVLTVATLPPPALMLSACHATPTVIRDSGTVRIHWRSTSANTIVINDGATDVATFTVGADTQAFLDAGFADLVVSADTTFTVTASNATENTDATTSVDVLSGADPTTYAEVVLGDSPVAYWQFEESAGSSAIFDSSNNGHDSTEIDGGITSGAPGAVNSAHANDGTGGIVVDLQLDPQDPDGDDTTGDVDPDNTEGWTIEAIVRPDTAAGSFDQHIAANQDGSGLGRSNFFIDQDGTLQSYFSGAPQSGAQRVANASWCHVILTVEFDSAATDPAAPYTLRYYIDGVLDAEVPDIPIEAANGNWVLGAHKSLTSAWLFGSLDEVSMYDTTLDQATITAHYNAFIADPGVAPLLGLDAVADSVVQGYSTQLFWKLGSTATSAVITDDQGGTIVADATAGSMIAVSPTVDTTYTLTVNGTEIATTTVTVDIPIRVTASGVNGGGFFEVAVNGLAEGTSYDLFFSTDLVTWTAVGIPQTADATGIATFGDTVAYDPVNDPRFFYRIGIAP